MTASRRPYLFFAQTLLVVEVLIALFVRDGFFRPYVGDCLVVMLLYTAVQALRPGPPLGRAVGVLLFSYLVEALQYLRLVEPLGWEENRFVRTIIGTGFDWADVVCYTMGIATVLLVERWRPDSLAAGVKKNAGGR